MRLPFIPEPLDVLKARYPSAVSTWIDAVAVRDGKAPAPSGIRTHVFDWEDGLRLIISKDRYPGLNGIHLSASTHPRSDLWEAILSGLCTPSDFSSIIVARWHALSGRFDTPELIGYSDFKLVPHFLVREPL